MSCAAWHFSLFLREHLLFFRYFPLFLLKRAKNRKGDPIPETDSVHLMMKSAYPQRISQRSVFGQFNNYVILHNPDRHCRPPLRPRPESSV
jgi:hypothetical protein